jgi:hypothetical protein
VAHITRHDYALRIRADDVDNLTRRVASAASQTPQAQRFSKDHGRQGRPQLQSNIDSKVPLQHRMRYFEAARERFQCTQFTRKHVSRHTLPDCGGTSQT